MFTNCYEKIRLDIEGNNPFAESCIGMYQITQAKIEVKIVFMEDPNLDVMRYNAPTSRTEVAAIIVNDDGEPPANKNIYIYPIWDNCKNISPMNRCSDPMVYTLLFPRGDCGWHMGIEQVEELSELEPHRHDISSFCAYRFQSITQ